ncbi:DUF805 domain-containing protein [uncultured Sphingomonas sp.]|uniref:DUF805 domain-containing protein n=1 Tax=uncultured Sphingomonas sp. TaxID=158754 RepID=UPI0035CA467F
MEQMLVPLRRYADFQGRSSRSEYWMFALGIVILYALMAGLLALVVAGMPRGGGTMAVVYLLYAVFAIVLLGLIVPSIAVQVRRLHDQDKTGWLVLIGLIPYLGGIVVLVLMCLPGTKGPNKFGPDPLDPTGAQVAGIFR